MCKRERDKVHTEREDKYKHGLYTLNEQSSITVDEFRLSRKPIWG